MENALFISLERSYDRRSNIRKQYEQLFNSNPLFLDAIDGRNLPPYVVFGKTIKEGYSVGRQMSSGEIGCTLSHIEAIKYASKNNWHHVIIFEDDVVLAFDIIERIEKLWSILPPTWEHVYLSGDVITKDLTPKSNFFHIQPSVYTKGTFAMILRETAYNKVMQYLLNFSTTTDDMYSSMIQKGVLESYTLYPFVAFAPDSYSTIWDKVEKRNDMGYSHFKNML